MEKSHRQKYRYDEARAMIFDRVLPFLTGKAWVNFLNGGSLDRLKHDTLNGEAKQSEPEQAMRNYQATALQKEEELTYLKGQCDGLLNQNEDLKNRHYECREALERIQRHLAYRAYRKIKDLMGHRG
jgi:hypothetical protein